jgi:hypothetical protein
VGHAFGLSRRAELALDFGHSRIDDLRRGVNFAWPLETRCLESEFSLLKTNVLWEAPRHPVPEMPAILPAEACPTKSVILCDVGHALACHGERSSPWRQAILCWYLAYRGISTCFLSTQKSSARVPSQGELRSP